MSAYNYMINAMQSGQLSEHSETLEDLNKKVEILHEWVKYLNERVKTLEMELQNGRR